MGPSAKNRVSMTSLSFFLVLAFACLSFVAAAPTDAAGITLRDSGKHYATSINSRGLSESVDTPLPHEVEGVVIPKSVDDDLEKRESAGLFWGPKTIGNLRLYVTNPHFGPVGTRFPKGANHVNFHVDIKGTRNDWPELVNLHIVRYSRAASECLYIWDSKSKKTIFDDCFDDWTRAFREGVQASKDFVDTLLRNADPIAYVAVIAAVGVALLAALASLGVVAVA